MIHVPAADDVSYIAKRLKEIQKDEGREEAKSSNPIPVSTYDGN